MVLSDMKGPSNGWWMVGGVGGDGGDGGDVWSLVVNQVLTAAADQRWNLACYALLCFALLTPAYISLSEPSKFVVSIT